MVEADRLAPRDGTAGMGQAEGEARVHVVRGAHALADREGRLVHELAHDPAEHEARRVLHPFGEDAQGREEALRGLAGERLRAGKASQLDEPRVVEWGEEMETHRAGLAALGEAAPGAQGYQRRAARQGLARAEARVHDQLRRAARA